MVQPGFAGKVALVTGGASGIGKATVEAFARQGAKLVVSDVNADAGSALVEKLRKEGAEAVFVGADVTKAADVEGLVRTAIETYGRLDAAFNNVGGGSPNPSLTELTEEEWDSTFALSLKSTWLCMKYELPHMIRQGGGAIVNSAALAGQVVTDKASPAYSAAKAGVIHLTRFTAVTQGKYNIRVNAVSPD